MPTLAASFTVLSTAADFTTLTTASFTPTVGDVIVVKYVNEGNGGVAGTCTDTQSNTAAPVQSGQQHLRTALDGGCRHC
jgi:hypothetical protein